MIKSRSCLLLSSLFVLGLSACQTAPVNRQEILTEPHFWQRVESSSAIYQRGPKAQQMLNRDIARCVTEIRELVRLGAIRYVTPGEVDEYGLVPDPEGPAGDLAQWETPERDGYLRAEYLPYHDFETCMTDKGWERVKHVPYDVADQAREDYIDAILGDHFQTTTQQRPLIPDPLPNDYEYRHE